MCSFLLRQHDEVDRYGGLTYSYPFRRQVPVSWTLWKSSAVDNDDLPSTADASKDAERCVLITVLCHLTKSPVEFLNGSLLLSPTAVRTIRTVRLNSLADIVSSFPCLRVLEREVHTHTFSVRAVDRRHERHLRLERPSRSPAPAKKSLQT